MTDDNDPRSAAARIVRELLSDLSAKRKKQVRDAIRQAIREWGNDMYSLGASDM